MIRLPLRHTILSALILAAALSAGAADAEGLRFEAGGISYAVYDYANPGRVATVTVREGGYTGAVTIPAEVDHDGVTYTVGRIDDLAFDAATSLTAISLPRSLVYIGRDAFRGCSSLASVNIEDVGAWCRIEFLSNPLSLAHRLYLDGSLVTTLRIPAGVTAIADMAFMGADCIESVVMPASLTSIGASAFAMCGGIRELVIPEPVSSIGNSAFYHASSLTRVWLPATLRRLGTLAFAECYSLKEMVVGVDYGTAVERGVQPFCYTPTQEGTLYVPAGSLSSYREQEGWGEWGTIVETASCAAPEISLAAGRLRFDCATAGAAINASVTSADFGTATAAAPVSRQLTGLYTVTAQASAPGLLTSAPAVAYVAWSLKENAVTGVDLPATSAADRAALLFRLDGGRLTVMGTAAGLPISVYDLTGALIHSQKADDGATTLTKTPPAGRPFIIYYDRHSYKVIL